MIKIKGPKYIEDNDLFYLLNQFEFDGYYIVHACISHLN